VQSGLDHGSKGDNAANRRASAGLLSRHEVSLNAGALVGLAASSLGALDVVVDRGAALINPCASLLYRQLIVYAFGSRPYLKG
jgi:hypothetical protein